ncbi:hypothetical protein BB560_007298 [Smittium megazygosporum]|uniref:Choline/carnitine acyltransferase domain-containing protein n=1 Tax=Smittium megazygosporum TaxID=133381 RepID=A0A2T9XX34_9FUNG|nr:hypothetical protein BB560_007298 [Smittium megazygosporum]
MSQQQRTFANQTSLQRLPIPPVAHTLSQYLDSLRPLLKASDLAETRKIVNDFSTPLNRLQGSNSTSSHSVADILQMRLSAYDATQQFHWLEKWWEETAYLTWRAPLIINSNYWLTFESIPFAYDQIQDKSIENNAKLMSREEKRSLVVFDSGFGEFQIRLAAAVAKETLPVERVGGKPICMNQYKGLFGVTRIPRTECDEIFKYKGTLTHFILMAKDQLFKIPLLSETGERLEIGDIEKDLFSAIEFCNSLNKSNMEPPVGLLTAGNRDRWSVAYAKLTCNPNSPSFKTISDIKTSAFVLSLEDFYSPKAGGQSSWQRLVKRGGKVGHNRWFDKHISYVVDRNGNLGANGEHSPIDAVVPAKLYNYVVTQINKNPFSKHQKSPCTQSLISSKPKFEHLKFGCLDSEIKSMISETEKEINALDNASASDNLTFKSFGSSFIKTGKVSPDAFIQMCIQLAYYRLHGEVVPTYESASTRAFRHGRTDTIRSLSQEMKDFVVGMCSNTTSDVQKYQLMAATAKKHVLTSRLASNGLGVDRHLLGLRYSFLKLASLRDEPKFPTEIAARLFNDSAMSNSSTWKLSTSGLFPNKTLVFTGFGCLPMPKCYGMNYTIMPDFIKFGIETKCGPEFSASSLDGFVDALVSSLEESRSLIERIQKNHPELLANKDKKPNTASRL